MSDYSVKAIFSAEDRGFSKAFEKAGAMAGVLSATTGKKLEAIGETFTSVGKKATLGFTVPIGLGFKKAVNISSEFESAMTGVRKTTTMTDEEFAKMSKSVQEMSKVLPAGTTEIAGVAEAAGQLGIKKKHLLDFTKTMIDLGYSTNLSSEEGAFALSRFANITQMSQKDFSKLGSTIVDLGNNFATSEAEIVDMGLRLAGTGAQVGLTEDQILGLSTAMSSVGIRAEAGGSAFSRVMQKMNTAVISGSDKLQGFADVAGLSAEEFSYKWKTKPQEAITDFINGLGKAKNQGVDTVSMLKELGINGIREVDTLSRLAGAGDLLSEAFWTANKAWKENTALAHEADMRYQTFESRMAMVKNRLDIVGEAIGTRLKPIIADFAEKLATLAEKFLDLSPGMQDFILKTALIAAAVGPVLLVIGTLAGVVAKAMSGFAAFTSTLKITSAGLKMTSIAGGGFGATLGTIAGKVIALAAKFAPVLAAIALFVAALKLAWDHSKIFRDVTTQVFDAVKEKFMELGNKLQEVGGRMAEAFGPMIEALGKIGAIVGQVLGPLFAVMAQTIGAVLIVALDTLTIGLEAICVVFETVTGFVTEFINGLITGIPEAINSLMEDWETFKTATVEVWATIKESITTSWSETKTAILEMGSAIVDGISQKWEDIKSKTQDTWENIKTTVSDKVGGLVSAVKTKFEEMKSTVTTVTENIRGALNTAWETIKSVVSGLIGGLVGTVSSKFEEMKSKIQTVTNNIKTTVTTTWNNIKSTVSNIVDGLKSSVINKFNELKTRASTSANNLKTTVTQAFTAMLTSVKTTVSQIPSTVAQGFTNAINRARSFFGQAAGVGRNLIMGFVSGVRAAAGRLISAVTGAVKGAIDGAKRLLGIHSPSTVFRGMGVNTIKGYIVGYDRMKNKMVESTKSMAQRAIDGFKSVPKTLQSTIDTVMDMSPMKLQSQINAVQDGAGNQSMPSTDNGEMSVELNLHLGNRAYKLFVDDISKAQGKDFELVEAYGY